MAAGEFGCGKCSAEMLVIRMHRIDDRSR